MSDSEFLKDLRGDSRKQSGVLGVSEAKKRWFHPPQPSLNCPQPECRTHSRVDLLSAGGRNTRHRPHPTTSRRDCCGSRDASDPASKLVDHDKCRRRNSARATDCAAILRLAAVALEGRSSQRGSGLQDPGEPHMRKPNYPIMPVVLAFMLVVSPLNAVAA